ncbi:hypothetical protein YYC_04787 [Plasmodium yoelii 17X]|uniref:Uncharacterized protein n=1 Tax=Plasmodium yoelii 17X TaxID=1323249 RepID=V7PEE1_PLAYE|nr:hypothetical protein YYC_04787 [Plasmodium yoelii 17X]
MDADICEEFQNVREWLPRELIEGNNKNINDNLKKYCDNGSCEDPFEKVNAGCLYFFDTFYKDESAFEMAIKRNINIVEYILIWLSYMLSLIKSNEDDNRTSFYNKYINAGDKYINNINYINGYNGYKDFIDRNNYFLSMDMGIISKLYDAFNTLCDIYNEFDTNNSNCANCLEKARQFVKKYEKFNIDYNTPENNSYFNVLITLLNGYYNLKNKCRNFPSISGISNIIYEQISEVTSSSSIASKLIPILSILVAIAIFLGISYKVNNKELKKKYYIYININEQSYSS